MNLIDEKESRTWENGFKINTYHFLEETIEKKKDNKVMHTQPKKKMEI